MNALKVLVVGGAVLLLSGFMDSCFAFHSGGVAECGGCHSMHSPAGGGVYLLLATDQTSTCLNCHEQPGDTGPSSYHVSTADTDMPQGIAPLQRNPGGDFGWLKKTYSFVVRGTTNTEAGNTHGHNVVAAEKGYTADPVNTTAPGGAFAAAQLACNSCHDPHGKYRRLSTGVIATTGAPIIASGSYDTSPVPTAGQAVGVYRLLAGAGYSKGGVTYPGAPAAIAPTSYNRSESATQTRVAYGHSLSGGHTSWGRWCATCHPDMHGDTSPNFVHPVDDRQMLSTVASIYNQYKKTGNMTGVSTSSYLSLVPFTETTSNYVTLASHAKSDDSYLQGPASTARVNCLTCHRAHASGAEFMLRWNYASTFITVAGAYPDNSTDPGNALGRTSAEWQAVYYDRPATTFATYQRSLCNKCHAKD